MAYDFTSLSYADFEDLSRDLIGRELSVRFEAFAAGPDGGMDGRHATASGDIILQAKHYAGSRPTDLKKTMKKERPAIERLSPHRYVLSTSCKLSNAGKSALATTIGPALRETGDIFAAADLNGLLRKYEDIERAHLKLWLSTTAVLERVLQAAQHTHAAITLDEIREKVRVYAPNESFNDAKGILEKQHVLIIAGPPGVGKTTLAEMLAYAYLAEEWQLVPIRKLDHGLEALNDTKKQVFYFDDFLGRVSLDKHALSRMDSDLARFIKRVRNSPNARFVLTTRAPIFEEARRFSEHLADKQLDISRYLLNVAVYTRGIRARILYNHLLVSGTPQPHINALIESGLLPKIIDHKNYNPRLIALMTEKSRLADIEAKDYPKAFCSTLDNPVQLWDIPFRKHIPATCQHLLIALFFLNQYGVSIDALQRSYEPLHAAMSDEFGTEKHPKDFEESLRILEGGFIAISNKAVTFVNPSVRDYLSDYLDDPKLLKIAARSSVRVDFAEAVWEHAKRDVAYGQSPALTELSKLFTDVARNIASWPVNRREREGQMTYTRWEDRSNSSRIELLLDLWFASREKEFRNAIREISKNPLDGWDVARDGEELIELIGKLRETGYYDEYVDAEDLSAELERGATTMLTSSSCNSEELLNIVRKAEEWGTFLSEELSEALRDAICREFDDIDEVLRNTDSESVIDDHIDALERLGTFAGLAQKDIQLATERALDRRAEINASVEVSDGASARSSRLFERDYFDDEALTALFEPLLKR